MPCPGTKWVKYRKRYNKDWEKEIGLRVDSTRKYTMYNSVQLTNLSIWMYVTITITVNSQHKITCSKIRPDWRTSYSCNYHTGLWVVGLPYVPCKHYELSYRVKFITWILFFIWFFFFVHDLIFQSWWSELAADVRSAVFRTYTFLSDGWFFSLSNWISPFSASGLMKTIRSLLCSFRELLP